MFSTHGCLYTALNILEGITESLVDIKDHSKPMTVHGIIFGIVPYANSWKRINLYIIMENEVWLVVTMYDNFEDKTIRISPKLLRSPFSISPCECSRKKFSALNGHIQY